MKNEKITGSLVLVDPQVKNDPMNKQGQIGILTYAREANENYVSFPKGGESVYAAKDLFLLKPKSEILMELMQNGHQLPVSDFKAMYKMMMLQDLGGASNLMSAMEIARDHPAIRDKTLEAVDRSEKISVENTLSR
jgi:hypothetical protein